MRTGVRVGSEDGLSGTDMAELWQGNMTHATIARCSWIIEVREILLLDKGSERIDVTMRFNICRVDIMVRQNDDLFTIEDLCILAKFLLKNTDGPRPADVMCQEDSCIDPNVIARLDD